MKSKVDGTAKRHIKIKTAKRIAKLWAVLGGTKKGFKSIKYTIKN